MQMRVARRLSHIGITFTHGGRDRVSAMADIGHVSEQSIPVLLCDFVHTRKMTDLKIECGPGRTFLRSMAAADSLEATNCR